MKKKPPLNPRNLEQTIRDDILITDYTLRHLTELDTMSQLAVITRYHEFAESIKPMYAKLKNKNGEKFIVKL